MPTLQVQDMETLQDLEIAKQKAFIEKLREILEYLVLKIIELIKEVTNCDAIVIRNESELHLLCFIVSQIQNSTVKQYQIKWLK